MYYIIVDKNLLLFVQVERAKLNELIVANKALHAPIDDDLSQLIGDAGLKVRETKNN